MFGRSTPKLNRNVAWDVLANELTETRIVVGLNGRRGRKLPLLFVDPLVLFEEQETHGENLGT